MKPCVEMVDLDRPADMMKRLDKQIFAVLLFLSLLSIVFSNVIFAGRTPTMAVIEVNGKEYGRYSLEEKERKILDVRTEFGYNKVEITNDGVFVTDTDCPDRLEIHQGGICNVGEMLVCLPNRFVVRLEGEREVDGVAY